MRKPLSTVCFELARYAADVNQEMLAYILRMAAGEALVNGVAAPDATHRLAGVWDWDISNDINHVDGRGAETLGIDPVLAAKGLPNATYLNTIFPEDLPVVNAALYSTIRTGGEFRHEFRVIRNDQIRWIAAEGYVTFDASRRPIRFPGAMFDVSHLRGAEPERQIALPVH